MKTQSTTNDCRCKACGALLAKLDRDGLTIRRGDMQVVVSGDSTVAVTAQNRAALRCSLGQLDRCAIYPGSHYVTEQQQLRGAIQNIRQTLTSAALNAVLDGLMAGVALAHTTQMRKIIKKKEM